MHNVNARSLPRRAECRLRGREEGGRGHLFDVEEVLGLEGDGHALHGDVVIVTRTVADICADGKCNWFDLSGEEMNEW